MLIDEKNALLLGFTRKQSWQVYTELIRQMLSKILEKLVYLGNQTVLQVLSPVASSDKDTSKKQNYKNQSGRRRRERIPEAPSAQPSPV